MAGRSVGLGEVRKLARELSRQDEAGKPLVVGGAPELAAVLRRELSRDARPGAVRGDDDPRGAALFVYVLADEPDEALLKRARRARVPVVAVTPAGVDSVPGVYATDIVRLRAGEGFPLEAIARAIAGRLGEEAVPIARRLPVLRRPVAERLVADFSRRNAILAAAIFIPGADLPVLALNELRLLLRIEQLYGLDVDPRKRVPEIIGTFGFGFGLRAVARELLDLVPGAGWLVKGVIAYAGTRAIGEAALRRLEAMPPRGEASRAAP
jgi:uncharacterized protein (DUF697 family)